MLFEAIPAINVIAVAVVFAARYAKETDIFPFILLQKLLAFPFFFLQQPDGSLVLSYFTK
jgi:hypothetical protein